MPTTSKQAQLPILDEPIGEVYRKYLGAMGLTRRYWPRPLPTGWLPFAATHGLLGAGLGYLSAPLVNALMPGVFQPGRLRTGMTAAGGLAGAALPALLALAAKRAGGGWGATYSTTGESYPWDKPAHITPTLDKSPRAGRLAALFRKCASLLPSSDMPSIGLSHTRAQIMSDMAMEPEEKVQALYYVDRAAGGQDSGLLQNPGQKLFGAMLGAGLGYGAASLGGKVMGAVFGLQPKHQTTLSRIGAVAGLLRGAGVI